jgi:catechol 2,3-dioxygenase-like lactoylglutathione lyase family enzyme
MELKMKIKLLVIRCNNIEKSKNFYEILGMSFVKESHNGGVIHYSTQIGDLVFEIYPSSLRYPICNTRLGFEPSVLEEKLRVLARDSYMHDDKIVYVLEDPDGRKVELY